MNVVRRFTQRVHAPGRTIRLRLTAMYGFLFLVSSVALLALTYVLFTRATEVTAFYQGEHGIIGSIDELPGRRTGQVVPPGGGPQLTPTQAEQQLQLLRDGALQQRSDNLHELILQGGIALAIMVVVAFVLGWIVAGRILRPLRTITTAARDISESHLNRRLNLTGPDDELKRLGDTFDDLLARLEAAFQAQRQFVANASHELRTPLARQRVLAQVVLADPNATVESLRTAHERVLTAGAVQERLIDSLLTLARGQAGFETREPFDIADLTRRAVATVAPEAAARGLALRARLDQARTAGNAYLAERLITNLLDNALRHNVLNGELEVATGVVNGRPELRVSNTGPQLSDETVERLFRPFQRLESTRGARSDGLGLGLSIVQAIANAHHAALDAHPRPGGGLSITVTFP